MLSKIRPIRGMRDLMYEELKYFNKILEIGKKLAKLYNYNEIILPIIEQSDVFLRTLGSDSDILTKETYTFLDREKRSVTLRPEFTASVVRSLISNGMIQQMPQRLFTYGALFRHERPQLGRYRQFYQINYEYFGSASPLSDVEMISLAMSIVKELGIGDAVKLEINTLGDVESIGNYKTALVKYFEKHKHDLSETSLKRLNKNPLRILDSKDEKDKALIKAAPNIVQYLNDDSWTHYSKVCDGLDNLEIEYKVNSKLVRGLDYYTHTVFEITTDMLGSQNAICAGGRYDNLIERMGGHYTPAVGFGMGIDRTCELLKRYLENHSTQEDLCYIVAYWRNS